MNTLFVLFLFSHFLVAQSTDANIKFEAQNIEYIECFGPNQDSEFLTITHNSPYSAGIEQGLKNSSDLDRYDSTYYFNETSVVYLPQRDDLEGDIELHVIQLEPIEETSQWIVHLAPKNEDSDLYCYGLQIQ